MFMGFNGVPAPTRAEFNGTEWKRERKLEFGYGFMGISVSEEWRSPSDLFMLNLGLRVGAARARKYSFQRFVLSSFL